jgi:hypothetical protein
MYFSVEFEWKFQPKYKYERMGRLWAWAIFVIDIDEIQNFFGSNISVEIHVEIKKDQK